MLITLETKPFAALETDALVSYVFEETDPVQGRVAEIDQASGGLLRKLAKSGELTGKMLEFTLIHVPAGLKAARVLLEREGLFVAGVAMTSNEAIRQAESLRPDVVLVDISLGEESGLDLAQRLVEDGFDAEATVVLISTRAEEDVADLVAVSPAAGFLPKAELSAAAIRRIVEGRASARRER